MKVNLIGRVRNTTLGAHHALLPVFEAVINSIHAIEEKGDGKGRIKVDFERDSSQQILEVAGAAVTKYPIKSFTVVDNGVGMTEENYASFTTSDTTKKMSKGGKGVGRFSWLKAFDHAEICSIFMAKEMMGREFKFVLSEDGIADLKTYSHKAQDTGTEVKLVDLAARFREHCPRNSRDIAQRILEHCLQYFVLGNAPRIEVANDDGGVHILNDIFATTVAKEGEAEKLTINGIDFSLQHLRIKTGIEDDHKLYFCADKRVVMSEGLEKKLPELQSKVFDGAGNQFFYAGYLSGKYLDDHVDNERTKFNISDQGDLFGSPGWKAILQSSISGAAQFLNPYIAPIREDKEKQITKYVQTQAPHYRIVLSKKRDALQAIAPNLSDEKLDLELYKIQQQFEAEVKEKGHALVQSFTDAAGNISQLVKKYETFLDEWNEVGIANLARHVVYRRATLEFLQKARNLTSEGKYSLEDLLHESIFPMKVTSDEVPEQKNNLWVIDDKLAFHQYLASDIPFKELKKDVIDAGGLDRPDIIVFDRPAAFVNEAPPFHSVVVIEFKRPARDDYTADDNPIEQVLRYARQIRAGKTKDKNGVPITVSGQVPIYAYIIADITPTLRIQAENASFIATPDDQGFFGFNPPVRAYVEIISIDKLIADAGKRNKFFFAQLFKGN